MNTKLKYSITNSRVGRIWPKTKSEYSKVIAKDLSLTSKNLTLRTEDMSIIKLPNESTRVNN